MKTYTIIPLDNGYNIQHEGKLSAIQGSHTTVIDDIKNKIGTFISTNMVVGDSTPITIEIKIKK